MATNDPTLKIKKFLGLNTMARDEELKPGELRKAENLDVTDSFRLRRRPGYTQLQSESYHSLWSCVVGAFVVSGDTLYEVDEDGALTAIRTGLTLNTPMAYEEVNSMVLYSNGHELGKIVDSNHVDWGVEQPEGSFGTSVVNGALRPGVYQVCITYVSTYGEESAASDPQSIELVSDSGISVSDLPAPASAEVASIRVYATHADDSVFFLTDVVSLPASVSVILNEVEYDKELKTQHLSRVTPCEQILYYNGRVYMVDGPYIWYTEPLAYGLVRRSKNFFMFPKNVTVFEAVDNGLFAVADKTYYLEGKEAPLMSQDAVLNATGVRGTGMVIDSQDFGKGEPLGDVAVWMSNRGVVAGMSDGTVQLLTERSVDFPTAEEGATALIKRDGLVQILSTLKEPTNDRESFSMGDRVTAEVRRNGVVI